MDQGLLQNLLEATLDSSNVYSQPPSNVQMKYPAIVFNRDAGANSFADNGPYREMKRYQVTVIQRQADSTIPDRISRLPMCKFERFFVADGLNHDVFTLYF